MVMVQGVSSMTKNPSVSPIARCAVRTRLAAGPDNTAFRHQRPPTNFIADANLVRRCQVRRLTGWRRRADHRPRNTRTPPASPSSAGAQPATSRRSRTPPRRLRRLTLPAVADRMPRRRRPAAIFAGSFSDSQPTSAAIMGIVRFGGRARRAGRQFPLTPTDVDHDPNPATQPDGYRPRRLDAGLRWPPSSPSPRDAIPSPEFRSSSPDSRPSSSRPPARPVHYR